MAAEHTVRSWDRPTAPYFSGIPHTCLYYSTHRQGADLGEKGMSGYIFVYTTFGMSHHRPVYTNRLMSTAYSEGDMLFGDIRASPKLQNKPQQTEKGSIKQCFSTKTQPD